VVNNAAALLNTHLQRLCFQRSPPLRSLWQAVRRWITGRSLVGETKSEHPLFAHAHARAHLTAFSCLLSCIVGVLVVVGVLFNLKVGVANGVVHC
jgi:hypothetical protein